MMEPEISPKQIMRSSDISRSFSTVKKRAMEEPVFVLNNNEVSIVILSYDDYLKLYEKASKNA